ncbi:MAG: Rpp14/Pop5 family protein [Halobacteriota archaeon]
MKPLSPTLRDRHRYIAFTAFSEERVTANSFIRELTQASLSLFGAVGVSAFAIKTISFDGFKGLLRCHYKHVDQVRAILASLSRVGNVRISILVLGTAGSIRSATEKYLQMEEKLRRNISSYVTVPVSGRAVRIRGNEIDIIPEDKEITDRADVHFIGITVCDNERLI